MCVCVCVNAFEVETEGRGETSASEIQSVTSHLMFVIKTDMEFSNDFFSSSCFLRKNVGKKRLFSFSLH